MTDQVTALLDEIQRLDQQATKGPWAAWPQMDEEGVTYPEYIEGPRNDLFGARGWDDKHYIQEVPELTMDDAEFIALARTFAPAAAKALRAVMELHQPYQYNGQGDSFCEGCSDIDWETSYPCPTVQAITDAMGDSDA